MINTMQRSSFQIPVKSGEAPIRGRATEKAPEILVSAGGDRNLPSASRAETRRPPFGEIIPMHAGAQEAPLVLVVDDQQTTRVACSVYLAHLGYRVQMASSRAEALEKVTPDTAVVLLKMLLPDGHGFAALKVIRSRFPKVRVVMVSGRDKAIGADMARTFGAVDYLSRPIRPDQLAAAVGRAVHPEPLPEDRLASA